MTPLEIIASINRSSLPTLCVEGVQDHAALRLLERQIGIAGAIITCGGRSNLLEVWKRRGDLGGKKVAFLADKDLYVYGKVPKEYHGVIFTNGYSLENDILESSRWELLQDDDDKLEYSNILGITMLYYWSQCKMALTGGLSPVWYSSYRVLEDYRKGIFAGVTGHENCCIFRKIHNNPKKYLRGKNLLECIHYSLSHSKRSVKYSPSHIIEISVKPKMGLRMKRLVAEIRSALG